ncbi:DgyrCDS342 [Dimorphilus gyrociliatus]|uniref:DgyrCDS342 n=1 Tax=Dimorphilus gyrociliatus TaxID=2664684 RepID=A0A7I8V5T4_9ANNE|nr:DgyrCDS342 [Dimorphilus gyrociliatus]
MFRKDKALFRKNSSSSIIIGNVIDYISKGKRKKLSPGLVNSIHQFSEKISEELLEMVDNVPVTSRESLQQSFLYVMENMFEDKIYTYERILCILVFGGLIAKRCIKEGRKNLINIVKELLEQFINDNILDWLNKHGGWEGYSAYFEEETIGVLLLKTGLAAAGVVTLAIAAIRLY